MAEGAPLLREYVPKAHRGFESLRLRQSSPIYWLLARNLQQLPKKLPITATRWDGQFSLFRKQGCLGALNSTHRPLLGPVRGEAVGPTENGDVRVAVIGNFFGNRRGFRAESQ